MQTKIDVIKKFQEVRAQQKLYFQTRWPNYLEKCKSLEYVMDKTIEEITKGYKFPELLAMANVARNMRLMQTLYFMTRDRNAMKEAKKLEAQLDAMLDDLLHPDTQLDLFDL
jgi:hypothetical protein